MTIVNRAWILVERPVGENLDSALILRETPMPEPGPGEVLMRTLLLSLDPANRTWMTRSSYTPAVPLGGPMRGSVIGRIERSNDPAFVPGDLVTGVGQWADYCAVRGAQLRKLPDRPGVKLTAWLGVLGVAGWTAYFGLTEVAKAQAGETLVVSGAAGAVGSIAGQIGRILGCHVVGIAGSAEKCAWLTGELGFDAAIDYRRENVRERLSALCPGGVNAYFENVGGAVGNAVVANLAQGGRVALCGLISQYIAGPVEGFDLSPVLVKSATVRGFIVPEFMARVDQAVAALAGWLADGRLHYRVDLVDGLENAVAAFRRLFVPGGDHMGKLIVRVDPTAA
jgi:NADPH-dependent curcumin reductase CurA